MIEVTVNYLQILIFLGIELGAVKNLLCTISWLLYQNDQFCYYLATLVHEEQFNLRGPLPYNMTCFSLTVQHNLFHIFLFFLKLWESIRQKQYILSEDISIVKPIQKKY